MPAHAAAPDDPRDDPSGEAQGLPSDLDGGLDDDALAQAQHAAYSQPVTGQIPRLELSPPEARKDPGQKILSGRFAMLWLIQFLCSLQFYLLTTIAAVFAMEQFGAGETAAGMTTSAFTVGAVIARLLTGKYLELIGRRRILVVGAIAFVLVSAAYLPVAGLTGLLVVRFLNGAVFAAITTVVPAAVQAVIPSRRRGEATGYFGLSITLATALGPAIGLTLSDAVGYTVLFGLVTAVSLVALVLMLVLRVPEITLTPQQREAARSWTLSSMLELKALPVSAVMIFVGVAYSTILSYLNAYAIELDMVAAASAFFVVYAIAIVISRPYLGRRQDRRGDNAVLLPALFLFAVTLVLLGLTVAPWMLLLVGVLLGFSYGAVLTAAQTAAVKRTSLTRVGLSTSTFFLCLDVGITLGPIVLGALAPLIGFRGVYITAGGVILASLVYYWFVHGRHDGGTPAPRTGAIQIR